MSEAALGELAAAGMRLGVPILLAALGEIGVERAGLVNVGIEGMMLGGAFCSVVIAHATGSPLLGLAAGAAAGLLLALVLAGVAIRAGGDPIVTGMGINLLALGLTGFAYQAAFGKTGSALAVARLVPVPLPGLAGIPLLGQALFAQPLTAYIAFALVALLWLFLGRSGLGLRLRAAGSAPHAATAAGSSVRRLRTGAVLLGGLLGGAGGAALALGHAGTFVENMTAGRGFMALAIVICARKSPWGALLASWLFGLALALQYEIQALGLAVPYQWARMVPYLATIGLLAFAAGRRKGLGAGGP